MGLRRKSREYALEILYQMELRKLERDSFLLIFNEYWEAKNLKMKKVPYEDLRAFTGDLVKGVLQHKEEVDAAITSHLKNWDLNRIAVIDKNVMRIALYELFYCDDIPREVTINEAIEAAKRYGSEESHHFVNAILDQVRPLEPESRL